MLISWSGCPRSTRWSTRWSRPEAVYSFINTWRIWSQWSHFMNNRDEAHVGPNYPAVLLHCEWLIDSVRFCKSTFLHFTKETNIDMNVVGLTGMSIGQSSARHSLVTQCRKTVDIFWFLCLTKRNTSKAKRPIWLLPFSKTVVWGSFSQLVQGENIRFKVLEQENLLEWTSPRYGLPKEEVVAEVIVGVPGGGGVAVVHENVPSIAQIKEE